MQELWKIIKDGITFINENLGIIIVLITAFATLVEKSPVAFKPISKILDKLNKMSNKEVIDEINIVKKNIDEINIKIDNLEEKTDDNERDRIRNEILMFGNALRCGQTFPKDNFEHIRDIYQKYHEKLHGNGLITEEYSYIMNIYNNIKF